MAARTTDHLPEKEGHRAMAGHPHPEKGLHLMANKILNFAT